LNPFSRLQGNNHAHALFLAASNDDMMIKNMPLFFRQSLYRSAKPGAKRRNIQGGN
jgi:hypothetical protein